MRRGLTTAAVFIAAAALIAGCGDYPRSRVHGTVKYQGKPLTNATVMFLTRDNQVYRAELAADGSYQVFGVVQGPVKVSIQQALPAVAPRPDPTPAGKAAKAAVNDEKAAARPDPPASTPREPAVKFPERYGDPNQSGLAFDLTEPDQEWSVDLK
jgi:hypothetical protein